MLRDMLIMQNCKKLGQDYNGGDWNIHHAGLHSLMGSPEIITGDFCCNANELTSLVDGPNKITGKFNCSFNELYSLIGGPKQVGGNYICENNAITSLIGCPQHITGAFSCSHNDELTSLVGGPQKVDGRYECDFNDLTDLVGCASHIAGVLLCDNNRITSLVGIHKIIKSCTGFGFDCPNIIDGGIGILLIENLTDISDYTKPFQIISKYLGQGTKGMMACSKELIAKGYDQYAKL